MPAAPTDVVFVGVDTHADAHHVALVDNLGRHLGDREFPADPGGYRNLLDWISRSDRSPVWEWKAPEPTEPSWAGY
jgi:hypothetical protein